MKITAETKQIIASVIDLTNAGHTPKQVGAQLDRSTSFVNALLKRLPKLIVQMESETA